MRKWLRRILRLLGWVARILGWGYLVLTVVDALVSVENRTALLSINGAAARLLPDALLGIWMVEMPTGGVLRGDFILMAVILLVVGWLCRRIASSLH